MTEIMWEESKKCLISEIEINMLSPEILSLHFIYHSTSKQGFDVGVQLYLIYIIFFSRWF